MYANKKRLHFEIKHNRLIISVGVTGLPSVIQSWLWIRSIQATHYVRMTFSFDKNQSSKLDDFSKTKKPPYGWLLLICGSYWIRTSDPLLVRHKKALICSFILPYTFISQPTVTTGNKRI